MPDLSPSHKQGEANAEDKSGEPLLGGMSMAQRFDAHVANNMRLEREMIERHWKRSE